MTQITADIIADSVNPDGERITSYLLTFPRFILAELNTHRAFSRNTASSRAVPVDKVIEQVRTDPAGPARWGRAGPGMQDHGRLAAGAADGCSRVWAEAAAGAADAAEWLADVGLVHKQFANRLLEPFVWTTSLVTATDYANFFALRMNRAAQPEMQKLAHAMARAMVASAPVARDWGEWHVPFGDQLPVGLTWSQRMAVAVARAARTSYLNHAGPFDLDADQALYDRLASAGHWSPFEHQAQAMRGGPWANFAGWRQLRWTFEGECRHDVDLSALLAAYEAEQGITSAESAVPAAGEVTPC